MNFRYACPRKIFLSRCVIMAKLITLKLITSRSRPSILLKPTKKIHFRFHKKFQFQTFPLNYNSSCSIAFTSSFWLLTCAALVLQIMNIRMVYNKTEQLKKVKFTRVKLQAESYLYIIYSVDIPMYLCLNDTHIIISFYISVPVVHCASYCSCIVSCMRQIHPLRL